MKKTLLLSAALFALAAGANAEVTWEGDVDLAGWGGLAEVPASAFANAKEGTVVRIKLGNITATEESPVQVQLALKTVEDFAWTQIVDCADVVGVDYYDYTVTDAVVGDTDETDLEMLKANGLNIKGQNAHVVKISLLGNGAGAVENVEAVDFNAPVEYYTLDGRRVNSADKGLYIVRQGKKVAKVIL